MVSWVFGKGGEWGTGWTLHLKQNRSLRLHLVQTVGDEGTEHVLLHLCIRPKPLGDYVSRDPTYRNQSVPTP